MQCVMCGKVFQRVARTVVCCGIALAAATGQPTRLQESVPGKVSEDMLRISVSTSTASVSRVSSLVSSAADNSLFLLSSPNISISTKVPRFVTNVASGST